MSETLLFDIFYFLFFLGGRWGYQKKHDVKAACVDFLAKMCRIR